MAGTLFVVATPIGNLEDLTFRALRTLREVDLVAAEDTRRSAKLLNHYEIRKPMVSLREHNEVRETPRLITRLMAGENVALVSDAGTPGIADPGVHLVRAAHAAGVRVVPIPGANAVATALSASGLPADEFLFLGFAPAHGKARDDWFDRLDLEARTTVFFEAPHRAIDTITRIAQFSVIRPVAVYREITKINETLVITPSNAMSASAVRPIGEFTVVLGPKPDDMREADDSDAIVVDSFFRLTKSGDISSIEACELIGAKHRLPVRAVAKLVKKAKISMKQSTPGLS